MTKPDRPPIIIIGMHRSGTSMVTRALGQLGLFTGWRKDENYEALFFQHLNIWMLGQSGGAWDYPLPSKQLIQDAEVRSLTSAYLRHTLRSIRFMEYLGPAKYIRYRNPHSPDFPWGWKDPRNTFTLPIWLDIFPNAKAVHVYRHGVDVAHSLYVRRNDGLRNANARLRLMKTMSPGGRQGRRLVDSLRCRSLEGAFALWEEYMLELQGLKATLGQNLLEIQYENLLHDPFPHLKELSDFCHLRADNVQFTTIASTLRDTRANAYLRDPHLKALADAWAPRLREFGY